MLISNHFIHCLRKSYLTSSSHFILHILSSINDYEDMPLLSLKMTVENLDSVLPKASQNAHIATQKCAQPDHGLTQDQSAALYFYTMNWKSSNQAISTQLNAALRSEDRTQIIPYFFYLKLIISALDKLKSVKKTVWRGVKADVSNDYPRGKIIIWQGFRYASAFLFIVVH